MYFSLVGLIEIFWGGGGDLRVLLYGTPSINVLLHFEERISGILWFVLFYVLLNLPKF